MNFAEHRNLLKNIDILICVYKDVAFYFTIYI